MPVYRIDMDHDMPLAERFGVKSIPTIVVLRAGRELERPLSEILSAINEQALEGFSPDDRRQIVDALQRVGENLGTA